MNDDQNFLLKCCKHCFIYLWVFFLFGHHTLLQASSDKPNIVFVLADDCTFNDIGCYGGQAKTPNIDHLAKEGMRFKQCFQAAPMCSPTRHNIYTGLYPVKSGAYPNHTFVKTGTRSVVHYLEPYGYRVALSGKRHIAPEEAFPFEYLGKGKNPDFEEVESFMKACRQKQRPFCLFLCSNEPHTPWNKGDVSQYKPEKLKLPPHYIDTPETREGYSRYLAEITYFDSQVGQAIKLIDKLGLSKNTLVMVASEQGSSMPFAKWTCYDLGLQSALVARWPGKIPADSVSNALVEYVDLLPTFIDAAGLNEKSVLDGKSFLPVLLGEQDEHKKFTYGVMTSRGIQKGPSHFGIRSVRSERYKYIWNFTPEIKFTNRCTESKLFKSWLKKANEGHKKSIKITRKYQHRPAEELYDIAKDPYEINNLVSNPAYKKVKLRLKSRLMLWMKEMHDRGQLTELDARKHQYSKK